MLRKETLSTINSRSADASNNDILPGNDGIVEQVDVQQRANNLDTCPEALTTKSINETKSEQLRKEETKPQNFEEWVERSEMAYDSNGKSREVRSLMSQDSNSKDDGDMLEGRKVASAEDLLEAGEKEIEVRVEMEDDDHCLQDGRSLKRLVITRSHIALSNPDTSPLGKVHERLAKVEIEEDILELPSGIQDAGDIDPACANTKTYVYKESGHLSDRHLGHSIPFERSITTTVVSLADHPSQHPIVYNPMKLPKYLHGLGVHYDTGPHDSISMKADVFVDEVIHQALDFINERNKSIG